MDSIVSLVFQSTLIVDSNDALVLENPEGRGEARREGLERTSAFLDQTNSVEYDSNCVRDLECFLFDTNALGQHA